MYLEEPKTGAIDSMARRGGKVSSCCLNYGGVQIRE